MRIMITGANSLLGKSLWETCPKTVNLLLTDLPSRPISVPKHDSTTLDVTQFRQWKNIVKTFQPNGIIHLAAASNVDFCESHPERAFRVNVQGTQNLIDSCKKQKITLIFTSSNGIFDGKNAPYSERSKPKPLHVYGKTKLQAEMRLKASRLPSLILRLITMYGWPPRGARQNPITWALEKLKSGQTLNMVNDNFVNPLYAPSAAEAIWMLVDADARGTFHIAGATRVSRFTWTKHIARTFGHNPKLVKSVSSDFFPSLTPRPRDTTFWTKKLQKTIGWKPLSLREGLKRMKRAKPRK